MSTLRFAIVLDRRFDEPHRKQAAHPTPDDPERPSLAALFINSTASM